MSLKSFLLILICVSETAFAALTRVGLVVDSGEPQVYSSVELAKKGLLKANSAFNLFYQLIDVEHDPKYLESIDALVQKGFDLIVSVGSRANDAACFLAPLHLKVRFVLIEGQCPDSSNLHRIQFDASMVARVLAKILIPRSVTGQVQLAWVEEQAGPSLDAAWKVMSALTKGQKITLHRFTVNPDTAASLVFKIRRQAYDGLVLFASPPIEKLWLRYWDPNSPIQVVSGPGDDGGVRLVKQVDEVVFDTIKRYVEHASPTFRHVYGFTNRGISLQLPKPLQNRDSYRNSIELSRSLWEPPKQLVH